MKRFWKIVALMSALVLVVGVAFGLDPVHAGTTLSCCVDWLEGWTQHTDGLVLLAGAAPAIPTEIKTKLEELKRLNWKQHEEFEPEINKLIEKKVGVAEMTQKFERINADVAKTIDDINETATKLAKETQDREEMIRKLNDRLSSAEKQFDPSTKTPPRKTPGQLFDESEAVEDARKRKYDMVGQVEVGLLPLRALRKLSNINDPRVVKSISGDDASAGALIDSLRLPGVITEPDISLNVQDLIPTTVIDTPDVDWVREDEENSTIVGGAGVVAETTSTDSLQAKPEVDIVFTLVQATMRTIAAWVAASKQILQDARRTQLRSYIDRRLMYSVDLELEDQILLGDGSGQNLAGLVPNATDYTGGYDQIQGADPTKIDTLRRAKTQARLAEYPVTGFVLHPTDWQDIELTKGSDLHYIIAMPGVMAVPRLWGTPVADSTRMTEGEFLVGAFALATELFTRGDATIEISRSHGNFFTANLVAILAEMRALLAIYRPKALIKGGFAAGSGS